MFGMSGQETVRVIEMETESRAGYEIFLIA